MSVFNEMIILVKDFLLVYIFGVGDLFLESKIVVNRDVIFVLMFIVGGIYLLLIGFLIILFK